MLYQVIDEELEDGGGVGGGGVWGGYFGGECGDGGWEGGCWEDWGRGDVWVRSPRWVGESGSWGVKMGYVTRLDLTELG